MDLTFSIPAAVFALGFAQARLPHGQSPAWGMVPKAKATHRT
jgi:hypothetical protein